MNDDIYTLPNQIRVIRINCQVMFVMDLPLRVA